MADRASDSEPISTNPKPLLLPVSRSEMTSALSTLPYCEKICSRSELLTR